MWSDETAEDINERINYNIPREYVRRMNRYDTPLYFIPIKTSIMLADELFGPANWETKIKWEKSTFEESTDDSGTKVYTCSVMMCMRITLISGAYREELGLAEATSEVKLEAQRQALSKAEMVALKRTLKQFGNALGNGLNQKALIDFYESQNYI